MKKEIKELTECSTLEELFETWQAKQVEEVNKLSEAIHNSPEKICVSEIFIKEHYKKKGNTISSHFIQFFDKDNCKNCSENKDFLSEEETSWEYVLKNAFNLDGCVGTFDVGEGFEYIFLLKEANDSAKTCIKNYFPGFELNPKNVNTWLLDWLDPEKNNKPKMLTKINNAMKQYFGLEEKEEFIFTSKAAYMNVNKRGGTFSTKGYDENAVINYAKEYREYILKEIELRTNQREKVTVFVCGGKGYFERLMKALGIEANEFKKYEIQSDNTKVVFVNIAHPSGWISADKLANSMKEG